MENKVQVADLREMGFEAAASDLEKKIEFKRKMLIAYENYRFVTPEIFNRFNEDLKERTIKRSGTKGKDLYHNYDKLVFKKVSEYKDSPPAQVLDDMRTAKAMGCFDTFEIAKIEATVEYKDPIVFGVIDGCDDRFFISQWDNDVKISDILREMEG